MQVERFDFTERAVLLVLVFLFCGGEVSLASHSGRELANLKFIQYMDKKLQRYLNYALEQKLRHDFLRYMDVGELADSLSIVHFYPNRLDRWVTPIWLQIAGLELVERGEGDYMIIPQEEVVKEDKILSGELKPCVIEEVRDDGRFSFEVTDKDSNFKIYTRAHPLLQQQAFREALPELYMSFNVE